MNDRSKGFFPLLRFNTERTVASSSSFWKNWVWEGESVLIKILFLGFLWGLAEIYLGGLIKSWQPALFGFLLPFLISLLLLWARWWVPATGALLLMGVLAATLKLFVSGMVFHGAFLAILVEAFLAEVVFFLIGTNVFSFSLIGMLIQFYSLFHPLLSKGVFCQSSHFVLFKRWLERFLFPGGQTTLSDSTTSLILMLAHLGVGLLAGLISWFLIRTVFHHKR
jgi:hypothetical protein